MLASRAGRWAGIARLAYRPRDSLPARSRKRVAALLLELVAAAGFGSAFSGSYVKSLVLAGMSTTLVAITDYVEGIRLEGCAVNFTLTKQ